MALKSVSVVLRGHAVLLEVSYRAGRAERIEAVSTAANSSAMRAVFDALRAAEGINGALSRPDVASAAALLPAYRDADPNNPYAVMITALSSRETEGEIHV